MSGGKQNLDKSTQDGLNTALQLTKATLDGKIEWSRVNNRPYVTYSASWNERTYRLQRSMVTETLTLFASQVGTTVSERLPSVFALGGLLAAIVDQRKASASSDASPSIRKRKTIKRSTDAGPRTKKHHGIEDAQPSEND